MRGTEGDATPFNEVNVEQVANLLHENGYQRHCNERLYNGVVYTHSRARARALSLSHSH